MEHAARLRRKPLNLYSSILFFSKVRQSSRFNSLHQVNQELILALLAPQAIPSENRKPQIDALCLLLSHLEVVLVSKGDTRTQIISDAFASASGKIFESNVVRQAEQKRREAVSEQILGSLALGSLFPRCDDVLDAHARTSDRVFLASRTGPQASVDREWSDFPAWLRDGGGLFWVHGGEASGKSSLMKNIASSPQTFDLLREWAATGDGTKLCSARFFFSPTGTTEQRSQSGLHRLMLYEILKAEPRLVPVIFPAEFSIAYCASLGYSLPLGLADTKDQHGAYNSVTQVRLLVYLACGPRANTTQRSSPGHRQP
jgi:hypothetical protein